MKKIYPLHVLVTFLIIICFFAGNAYGQEKKSIPGFSFWTVGNSVKPRFGEDLYKTLDELEQNRNDFNCLLQALSIESQTKKEILARCDISSIWLNRAIDGLTAHNCLGKTGHSKFYSKIPIMTNDRMKQNQKVLEPIAHRVAEKMMAGIPRVKQTYNKFKTDNDPDWQDISHLIIDKLVIDASFHHRLVTLEKEKGLKKHYSQDQKKIPAFFMEKESQYGTFGVNWYGFKGDKEERHVYVLHGAPFKRFHIPFNQYGRKKYFSEIFNRVKIDGGLEKLTADEIKIFKDLGWVKNNRLVVPFVHSSSLKVLKNDLQKIGNEAAEVAFKNISIILDSYRQSSISKYSDGAGDYIQVCYHLLFSGIINELIKLNAIPSIPDPAPDYFGVYITIGSYFN